MKNHTLSAAALRLLFVPLLLAGGTTRAADQTDQGQPNTLKVETQPITETITVDGTIEATNRATLTAQTSGRVKKVNYDVDDYVTAGSVVIELENTEQKARLDQAKGREKEAQAAVDEAQKNFDRVSKLVKQGSLSQSDFDRSKSRLDGAKARLDQTQAAVKQADKQLSYTIIRAPYTGIVTQRFIEPGELATPGRKLIAGLSLEHIRVNASVSQQYVDRVRQQKQLTVILPDGKEVTTQNVTVFPYADDQSHTFRVRGELDAGTRGIYPGMFVKVEIATGQRQAIMIPSDSIFSRGELTAVYVIDDKGTPHLRQIREGQVRGDLTEVLAGLEPGETIARNPQQVMAQLAAGQE